MFRPVLSDVAKRRLAPHRLDGTWDDAVARAIDRAEELEKRVNDAVKLIDDVFDQDDGKHPMGYYSILRQILTGKCTGCGEGLQCDETNCRHYEAAAPQEGEDGNL